jgi:aprataxin
MPLVVTADGGELPLPASSTQMGRAVCRRLGIDAEADKFAVSRVQCEVSVVDDGAGLRVTSLGTNPTPWFPAAEKHARRVLAKGESATLRDGDGFGLVQTEPSPGSMRWRREPNPNPNPNPNPPRDEPEPEPEPAAKRPKTADERTTPDASIDAVPGPSAVPDPDSASAPPSRPVVLILVGPPGAGKSTLCASLPASAWTSVNQDTIGKHGKPGSRDQCVSAVKRALTLGKHVAVDRCHLTEEQRAFFVDVARDRGAEAHAIHLNLPRDVILDRVRRRLNHVSVNGEKGVGVAKRMMGQKANAPPTRDEGFECVVTCRDDVDVRDAARTYAAMPRAAAGTNATAIRGAAAKAEAATSAPQSRTTTTTTSAPQSRTTTPNALATMMRAAKNKTAAAKSLEPSLSTSEPNPKDPWKPSNSNATGAPWLRALVDVASDPSGKPGVLSHDDEIVVLRDAYPKARAHVLVLARDPALRDGPSSLRAAHVPLVEKMLAAARSAMGRALVESPATAAAADADAGAPSRVVRFGFHAKPSMPQLHMHAVSQDLRGSSMKTRRHWNTFATDFFRDASEVLDELRARGALEWDEEEAESRVKMERLRCHACGDGPHATMPKLFEHLDRCVAAPPGETIENIE